MKGMKVPQLITTHILLFRLAIEVSNYRATWHLSTNETGKYPSQKTLLAIEEPRSKLRGIHSKQLSLQRLLV